MLAPLPGGATQHPGEKNTWDRNPKHKVQGTLIRDTCIVMPPFVQTMKQLQIQQKIQRFFSLSLELAPPPTPQLADIKTDTVIRREEKLRERRG